MRLSAHIVLLKHTINIEPSVSAPKVTSTRYRPPALQTQLSSPSPPLALTKAPASDQGQTKAVTASRATPSLTRLRKRRRL